MTLSLVSLLFVASTLAAVDKFMYPLIVGDVDSVRAAFSLRTLHESVQLTVKQATGDQTPLVNVTLPSVMRVISMEDELALASLPLLSGLGVTPTAAVTPVRTHLMQAKTNSFAFVAQNSLTTCIATFLFRSHDKKINHIFLDFFFFFLVQNLTWDNREPRTRIKNISVGNV